MLADSRKLVAGDDPIDVVRAGLECRWRHTGRQQQQQHFGWVCAPVDDAPFVACHVALRSQTGVAAAAACPAAASSSLNGTGTPDELGAVDASVPVLGSHSSCPGEGDVGGDDGIEVEIGPLRTGSWALTSEDR